MDQAAKLANRQFVGQLVNLLAKQLVSESLDAALPDVSALKLPGGTQEHSRLDCVPKQVPQ